MVFTAAQKRAYAIRMAAARATAAKKAASARAAKKKPEAKKKPSRRQGFQTHLTGRGDYYSTAGMDYPGVGGELGKSFATAIGGPSFAELGKFLGHGAHKMLKSLTGFGDYVVNENSLMRLPIMNPPEVVNSSAGFIVRHRVHNGCGSACSIHKCIICIEPRYESNISLVSWCSGIIRKL